MNVLGIDFETTGVDPKKDKIWEIGLSVLNTKTKSILASFSSLINYKEGITIPDEIQKLCRILPEDVARFGAIPITVPGAIDEICKSYNVQAFVAHNCNFEISFLDEARKGFVFESGALPWFDTMTDIQYPDFMLGRGLEALCTYHRIVNLTPHRALSDVSAMLEILKHYDIEEIKTNFVKMMESETFVVEASVDFHRKELAKKEKFMWEGCGGKIFPKKWVKLMTETEIANHKFPFNVKRIEKLTPRRYL